jgi:hypothetical protein
MGLPLNANAEPWLFREDPPSRERLVMEVRRQGFAVVRPDAIELGAETAARAPWEVAERVFGAPVELVERQPIAPVPWGKSFASTSAATPLHSDSQLWRNLPPHAQLMFCAKSAPTGGETLLVDTWSLLEGVERSDPELFHWLFDRPRRMPFLFGDIDGPTVSNRESSLVFTHSPRPLPNDAVAARLEKVLAAITPISLRIDDGELCVVDNHRMLHGRTAFSGDARRFTRLLVWLARPFGAPSRYLERATIVPTRSVPAEVGLRRRAVLDMLRGVPPGVLAQRLAVPEKLLYLWRDAALAAIDGALGESNQGQP